MEVSQLVQGVHYGPAPWAKTARAKRHYRDLNRMVEDWNDRNPIHPQQRILDDEHTIEVWYDDARRPPIGLWQTEASGIFQNLRDALEQLNFALSSSSGSPFKERQVSFPLTDSKESWAVWDKRNPHHLPLVRKRYYSVQPFVPGNPPTLTVLRELNDAEKHREGMRLRGSLQSLETGGNYTIEGLISETGGPESVLSLDYSSFDPDESSPVVVRLQSTAKIKGIDLDVTTGYVKLEPEIPTGFERPLSLGDMPEFISHIERVLNIVTDGHA